MDMHFKSHRSRVMSVLRPPLSVEQILAWADAHHAATGEWPRANSARAAGAPGPTWRTIDGILRLGRRGLPGGTSLSRLLDAHRGPSRRHHLTIEMILAWADAHRAATGKWPRYRFGRVPGAEGIAWSTIDSALKQGRHGLPGGSSLSRLLDAHRGPERRRHLTIDQILAWADSHHAATGKWPRNDSAKACENQPVSWSTIESALRTGLYGLPGGTSLSRLLDKHRRPQRNRALARKQILAWAETHRATTGQWPEASSGAVAGAPGLTWKIIDRALRVGLRGLSPGISLSHLLSHPATRSSELSLEQVLAWGEAHYAATGQWPTTLAGQILGALGET